jgi:nitrite reductase (cytochrome c-552)
MNQDTTTRLNAAGDPRWGGTLRLVVVTVVIAALAVFAVTAVLVNIFERKQEARNPFFRVVELTDETDDPAVWGKDFPMQYDGYLRTVDMERTRYGGSEALPRAATSDDPRMVVSRSKLELDPRLVAMWAGYAFSVDYREKRGHAYMLEDQMFTRRQAFAPQPGTCLHCHASVYVAMRKLGGGDLTKGFEAINKMPYAEARKLVTHPVACIDCHDPQTMQLRITRPAFMEGIRAYKASQGVRDYDVNRDATRQEMRAYVCGQCHVEYYFRGKEKRLTFPWSKGIKADEILAYYDDVDGAPFKDWVHQETGAPVLKAQHPEFELWNQGVHARAGVACADCHMPYKRVGALKISDHNVRSPLLSINNACQTCHKVPEAELKDRAEMIQTRTMEVRKLAMDALIDLIADIKAARGMGATDERLAGPRDCQRRAQFLIDFIEAENSGGFHAGQESVRVLSEAIDFVRKGQLAVRQTGLRLPTNQPATQGGVGRQ